MTFVFISYSRQDKVEVTELSNWLVSAGVECWFDRHMAAGERFRETIRDRLREARAAVVVWSDGSSVSEWVQDEASYAARLDKLIPVALPGFDKERIPLGLSGRHTIEINDTAGLSQALRRFGIEFKPDRECECKNGSARASGEYGVPLFDSLLAERDEELCLRLRRIRDPIAEQLRRIPVTHYSHDSLSHAVQCTNLGAELFEEAILNQLSPYETFVFGLFCFVHDIGMAPRSGISPERIYQGHTVHAQRYVEQLGDQGVLGSGEVADVATLCLMHNKELSRAKIHFNRCGTGDARLAILFSMFRIVDMLDVETQAGEILRIKPEIVGQVIGSLCFEPEKRRLTIWRGSRIEDDHFAQWEDFFRERIRGFNKELREVNASVKWSVAQQPPSGMRT